MTRIALALLACLALAPSARATTAVLTDQGEIVNVQEGVNGPDAPPLDTPDIDVACLPLEAICHAAKVHTAKRKTSRVYGEFTSGYHRRMISAILETTWTRDRWRVVQPVVGQIIPFVSGEAIAWSYDHQDPITGYPYAYKNHGMGSGYVLQTAVFFKACIPLTPYCPTFRRISLRLNLHADGTVKRFAHVAH